MARKRATASRQMRWLLKKRRQAVRGDTRAQEALRSTVERWTRRANIMLDRLEAHGYTRQAYQSALTFIQSAYGDDETRFQFDLKNPTALYKQAMALNHFFTLETSTITGSRAVDRRRIAAFRERFKNSRAIQQMTNKDIREFFDFLHDTPVGTFLKDTQRYESGDEMDTFMEAMYLHGHEADEITKALAAYQRTKDWAHDHPGVKQPEQERFYFEDLRNYLKGDYDIKWKGFEYTIKKEADASRGKRTSNRRR